MFRSKLGAVFVGSALLMAACGGSAATPAATPSSTSTSSSASSSAASSTTAKPAKSAPAATSSTKPLESVDLRLAWLPEGDAPPFALGLLKGYYKAEGLNVTIKPGKGSPITGESVANGHDTFGWMDSGSAITLISKGAPIKVIAIYQQQSPMSLEYEPPNKLNTPADLKGKTIYTAASSPERELLPALLAKAGLTMKDIHLQIVSVSQEDSILATHPDGYVTGYDNADYPVMLKVAPKAVYKSYSSFGINVMNLGLVASLTEIKNHPGTVRRFVAASTRAWEYAVKHPNQASRDLVKVFPKTTQLKSIAAGFAVTKTLLHTANTQGHPAGWMSAKDWAQSLKLMHQYGGVKTLKPAADYYTNQFIPSR